MSNERHNSVASDEAVRRVYRELADETAPGQLDRSVLKTAALAARPGYARSRAWARPLAWAATVVLSVAIVLELSQEPVPRQIPVGDPVEARDEAGLTPPAAPPAASAAIAEGRSADVMQGAREKANMMQKTSALSAVRSAGAETEQQADAPVPTEGREAAAIAIDSRAVAGDAGSCPPEATRQPSTWLECIEDMKAAGLVEKADAERRLLRQAFPGIELR